MPLSWVMHLLPPGRGAPCQLAYFPSFFRTRCLRANSSEGFDASGKKTVLKLVLKPDCITRIKSNRMKDDIRLLGPTVFWQVYQGLTAV